MSDQSVEARINEHLEEENRRLEAEVERLRYQVQVQTQQQASQQAGLNEIVKYLPQLGQLSTNTSMVASAVQSVTTQLAGDSKATRAEISDLTEATRLNTRANEQIADRLHRIVEALEEVSEAWLRKDLREA